MHKWLIQKLIQNLLTSNCWGKWPPPNFWFVATFTSNSPWQLILKGYDILHFAEVIKSYFLACRIQHKSRDYTVDITGRDPLSRSIGGASFNITELLDSEILGVGVPTPTRLEVEYWEKSCAKSWPILRLIFSSYRKKSITSKCHSKICLHGLKDNYINLHS